MKCIIAGGRDFDDYNRLVKIMDKCPYEITEVVCGKARGADSLGELYAANRGYNINRFPADWDRWGKSAGYRRNKDMVDVADIVIAFWDGVSRGTKHTIDITKSSNKPCQVFNY